MRVYTYVCACACARARACLCVCVCVCVCLAFYLNPGSQLHFRVVPLFDYLYLFLQEESMRMDGSLPIHAGRTGSLRTSKHEHQSGRGQQVHFTRLS